MSIGYHVVERASIALFVLVAALNYASYQSALLRR